MKNLVPETMGYEYFKKQNDWVLKKNSFNNNNRTLRHFKVLRKGFVKVGNSQDNNYYSCNSRDQKWWQSHHLNTQCQVWVGVGGGPPHTVGVWGTSPIEFFLILSPGVAFWAISGQFGFLV